MFGVRVKIFNFLGFGGIQFEFWWGVKLIFWEGGGKFDFFILQRILLKNFTQDFTKDFAKEMILRSILRRILIKTCHARLTRGRASARCETKVMGKTENIWFWFCRACSARREGSQAPNAF